MTFERPTSPQPCGWSLRGRSHPPQILLRSTRRLCFSQASRPYKGTCTRYASAFIFSSIYRSLTCNPGQGYTLLSAQAQKQLSPVEISGDRLIFTQSDMHPSNFGVDQHGKTVLLDLAEIGLLPKTFVTHTMSSEKRLAPIVIALSLSDSSNASMAAISYRHRPGRAW